MARPQIEEVEGKLQKLLGPSDSRVAEIGP
jgi:hypothetical protein